MKNVKKSPSTIERRFSSSTRTAFTRQRRIILGVATGIAVAIILLNVQIYSGWTNYKTAFGSNSPPQQFVDRQLLNFSLDIVDALYAIQQLESTALRYTINQTSLQILEAQRRHTISVLDRFKPSTAKWSEMRSIESYDKALKNANTFVDAVHDFELGVIEIDSVIASAGNAKDSWLILKTECIKMEVGLRDGMGKIITDFHTMANKTWSIIIFLSVISALLFATGLYVILMLVTVQHRRFRKFELVVASIGHDLRRPLQSLQSVSDLLCSAISTTERIKYSGIVNTAIKTMSRLVDDIVLAPQGRSYELQLVYIDLSKWFHEFISGYQDSAKSRGLQLTTTIDIGNMLVEIDPDRMTQSLGNLVDNALKYTGKGSVSVNIRLRTQDNDDHKYLLVVMVRDTGVGIARSDQERIFRAFERADNTGSVLGMGLGLSIVKRMVESYPGGSIDVQSTVGQGSTFKLILPVRIRDKYSASSNDEVAESSQFGADRQQSISSVKEILIVGDDPYICKAMVGILREAAFAVDTAANGPEALLKLANGAYKVVISDIKMPGMNGFELANLIRSNVPDPQPYLIGMTASSNALGEDPRAKVFNGLLSKPFDEEKLILLIEQAMEGDSKIPGQTDWGSLKA